VIASEPFSDLPGVWHEIDESSAVIVRGGGVLEHKPFRPQVPESAGPKGPAIELDEKRKPVFPRERV
jgi:hypothetical protein